MKEMRLQVNYEKGTQKKELAWKRILQLENFGGFRTGTIAAANFLMSSEERGSLKGP